MRTAVHSHVVIAAATMLAFAGTCAVAAADGPQAHAAKRCSVRGVERKLGPSYVTSLSVSGTSCANGKKLIKAYYRCRVRSGGAKGRCHRRVLGYRCSERRAGIPIQFDARVRCHKGRRHINHTYTQNT